ncbi:MAG: hypothetical protein Q8M88_10065 [Phenylobacterium sp.]|uniref:hypothetical protein n=1 Tax=Phenylobacterium sp. TaxID=1871053 RepID=UPI0027349CED|nr:hypothetical protein [Phenylobacterium sp.]MDP3174766.1 hypothetical protein [Phenylobacterium sp.]
MSIPNAVRLATAERLSDYFALQLRFAETMALRTDGSIREAVETYTNLRRRFGLPGLPQEDAAIRWRAYLDGVERRTALSERVAWTRETFARSPEETPPAGHVAFGCFSYEPPDDHGVARIHFNNLDSGDGMGPLALAKAPRRREELGRLVAALAAAHPDAARIRGASWLYNVESYRRLFPHAYVASRSAPSYARLSGTSSWGQFLDHTGAVKPDLRDAFLKNLGSLDVETPWRVFPLSALVAEAPIEVFIEQYGAGGDLR